MRRREGERGREVNKEEQGKRGFYSSSQSRVFFPF